MPCGKVVTKKGFYKHMIHGLMSMEYSKFKAWRVVCKQWKIRNK